MAAIDRKNYTQQEAGQLGLGWVDPNNPNYGQAGYVGSETTAPAQSPAGSLHGDVSATQVLPAPPTTGAATPAPAPSSTADRETAAGIQDRGNNLVYVPSYGGLVDRNSEIYKQALGATPGATPTGAVPGGAGGTSPVPGEPPKTINDAFRSALMTQLNTSPDVSLNDPALKSQSDAFSLSQQRSQERSQNTLAEQAALDGTNTSGGFTSDKLGLEQGRAQAEGGFNADLVGRELQNRRSQIMQALQMGAGYLSDQEHQALQKQLAEMDAAIRREGISSQSSIAAGDLGFRNRALDVQSNLGLLQALLGNEQAGNAVGFNYAALQEQANRAATMAALGR